MKIEKEAGKTIVLCQKSKDIWTPYHAGAKRSKEEIDAMNPADIASLLKKVAVETYGGRPKSGPGASQMKDSKAWNRLIDGPLKQSHYNGLWEVAYNPGRLKPSVLQRAKTACYFVDEKGNPDSSAAYLYRKVSQMLAVFETNINAPGHVERCSELYALLYMLMDDEAQKALHNAIFKGYLPHKSESTGETFFEYWRGRGLWTYG